MCIKDMKHIEQNFHSVGWLMSRVGLGSTVGQKLDMGICDGAPSTTCSSYFIIVSSLFFCLLNQSIKQFQIRQGILLSFRVHTV